MFQFIKKYSPGYGRNTIEGWSVIPVVAVGAEASTFADSWLGMALLFVVGTACAHVMACIMKYFIGSHFS